MFNLFRAILAGSVLAFFLACSGGGSDAKPSPAPAPTSSHTVTINNDDGGANVGTSSPTTVSDGADLTVRFSLKSGRALVSTNSSLPGILEGKW